MLRRPTLALLCALAGAHVVAAETSAGESPASTAATNTTPAAVPSAGYAQAPSPSAPSPSPTSAISLARYARVAIEPTKTSIYVGSVTMTMPTFTRKGTVYESTYAAKVFPYFFSSEQGKLFIEVPDEALQRLARGEQIEFKGHGTRDDGVERRVEGKATPTDAISGKIKVRVFVSKRIELIFNTTYRFSP